MLVLPVVTLGRGLMLVNWCSPIMGTLPLLHTTPSLVLPGMRPTSILERRHSLGMIMVLSLWPLVSTQKSMTQPSPLQKIHTPLTALRRPLMERFLLWPMLFLVVIMKNQVVVEKAKAKAEPSQHTSVPWQMKICALVSALRGVKQAALLWHFRQW